MRKLSGVSIAMVMAIALYFMLFWGFDALRVLTSPTYGLEDVWRSQYVFGIGSVFGIGPQGLIQLAAFFGTLKLAVAGICAVHIADRFYSFATGRPVSDVLEGALILVILVSVAAAAPAAWSHNLDLVREQAIQLVFAGLAIALGMIERNYSKAVDAPAVQAAVPRGATWYSPWR